MGRAGERSIGRTGPALVLTAGLATRLQPLSSVRAKAALPVAGTPLVTRILRWLHARRRPPRRAQPASPRRLHHAHRRRRLARSASSVRYSWETEILGSAGGPARAVPLLEADRFLIVNGDTLADVDLRAMAAQHVDTNAMVTMAVVDGDPRYNGVIADDSGIVRGFGREPGAFHFIGVQAVNASVFAGVDPDTKSETVHGIYPALIASRTGAIRIFHARGRVSSTSDRRGTTSTRRSRSRHARAGRSIAATAR